MPLGSSASRRLACLVLGVLLVAISGCDASSSVAALPTDIATVAPTAVVTAAPPTATPLRPTSTPAPSLRAQLVVHLFSSIAPNSNSPIVDLTCPAGYVVAGGGVNSGYTTIVPMQDAPINATTWRAEIFNTSSTQTISVQVQVDCLEGVGVPLASQIITKSLGTIAVGDVGTAVLTCPAGYVVAGGGFASGYPTFNVVWNAPLSTTSWQAEVYNTASSPIGLQAQIACLSAPTLAAQVLTHSLGNAPPDGTSTSLVTACPAGAFVGGGGLNGNGSYSWVEVWDAPVDTHTWRSEVYNGNPIHTLVAENRFICLHLA